MKHSGIVSVPSPKPPAVGNAPREGAKHGIEIDLGFVIRRKLPSEGIRK